jgi:putative DNA primase/helicase
MLTISDLPDVKLTANGSFRQSQPLTKANVMKVLEYMGVTVRLNMMVGAVSYTIGGELVPQDDTGAVIEGISDILVKLDINNLGRLDSLLLEIARQDKFHPMEEWLKGLVWDGTPRVDALAASITTGNPLWPVYLENWLVQVVEGVCGWRSREDKKSLPHVLTLVGRQGTGKSHWLKLLGGCWFKGEAELHLSSPSGKDHQIAALKFPMVELAELDGIFRKSDISHMKAFISREEDEIRAPYDRRALIRPRMTVFCASVNDAEFLTDTSGSRRYWPVLVEYIDWSYVVDMEQIWAEAYAMWQENSDFNLSAEEDALRASIAVEVHQQWTPEAERIMEFYRRHHGNPKYPDVPMNRTEILAMLYGEGRQFWPKTVSDTGKVLADLLGKHKTIDGKQRSWMFPYNEFATDLASWPDKNHLKSV